MFAVETTELVVSDLHELGSLALIAAALLQCTLYKACLQSILGLVKAVKRKIFKRKRFLPVIACF